LPHDAYFDQTYAHRLSSFTLLCHEEFDQTLPTRASLPQLRAARASRGTTWSAGAGEHNFGGDRATGGNVAPRRQFTSHCGRGRASARAEHRRTARGASIQQDFDLRRITNEVNGNLLSEFTYNRDVAAGRVTTWTQAASGVPTKTTSSNRSTTMANDPGSHIFT
jgi:hypothetical protein